MENKRLEMRNEKLKRDIGMNIPSLIINGRRALIRKSQVNIILLKYYLKNYQNQIIVTRVLKVIREE